MEDIILLGIGGHAHSVVDSIECAGKYRIVGFLDLEEKKGISYRGYKVLDADLQMEQYFLSGVGNAFVSIGYMGQGQLRENLYRTLKKIGYTIPNIVDPTAVIAEDAVMGEGVFVGKKAVVNAAAHIGDLCIINTGAIVEHDCDVGSFSHISVGSVLCGGVCVGQRTLIGANATVIQERVIGSGCIVGAGTTVRRNLEDGCTVRGSDETKIVRNG